MKKDKNILITFDYELFLGAKSGNVDDCMLNPTNAIVEILNRFHLKAIFFVDSYYLYKISISNVPKIAEDYKNIKHQLQQLVSGGHYVMPHIHPHWLDAKYMAENNQWDLTNTTKYRFNSLSDDEKEEVFEKSINVLKEVCLQADSNYIIDAYRAGGWSIQPFKEFYPFFKKYGIKYDFSVMAGFKHITECQQYDFTKVPFKAFYNFEDDIAIEEENGSFGEFTISALEIPSFNKVMDKMLLKILWKLGDRGYGKGESVDNTTKVFESLYDEMVSIELLTFAKKSVYDNYFKNNDFMQFISHPKMLSKHNISIFEQLIRKWNKKFQLETDYHKMVNAL